MTENHQKIYNLKISSIFTLGAAYFPGGLPIFQGLLLTTVLDRGLWILGVGSWVLDLARGTG